MAFYDKFPYTNFQEINLDRIIAEIKGLREDWEQWKPMHSITIANPIEWTGTLEYEAYTIVKGTDGNSYLSLKYVPAGISLYNAEYWQKIADYSEIDEGLYRLVNRQYISIGDSYNTAFVPPGGVLTVPWSEYLRNMVPHVAWFDSGVAGSGFVSGTLTFQQQLNNIAATIQNKNDITDIIVLGGVNDADKSEAIITAGIESFIGYCAETFPNAIVTIGMVSGTRNWVGKKRLMHLNDLFQTVISPYTNARVIGNAPAYYHNYDQYQPDDHPLPAGAKQIAYYVANYLKTGVSTVTESREETIPFVNTDLPMPSDHGLEIIETIQDMSASLYVKWTNSVDILTAATNVTMNTRYKIAELPDRLMRIAQAGIYTVIYSRPCAMYNNQTYTHVLFELSVFGNDVFLAFRDTSSTLNTDNQPYNGLTRLVHLDTSYSDEKTFPLMLV